MNNEVVRRMKTAAVWALAGGLGWTAPCGFAQVTGRVERIYRPPAYEDIRVDGILGEGCRRNAYETLLKLPYYAYFRTYTPGVCAFWPSGEFLGKFEQGLMCNYRSYGDSAFLTKAMEIVDLWCQRQAPDGYIATSPEGFQTGSRWVQWSVWEHKYVLLGLLDFYRDHAERQVLAAAVKAGDILCDTFGPQADKRKLSATGHAGMVGLSVLEPMADLYKRTGNRKYFDFCTYILSDMESAKGPKIITELTRGSGRVDKVGNGKGYEMLSCLIGLVQMYRLTGNADCLAAAEQACRDIVANRLYITGTATQCEGFHDNGFLPADETSSVPIIAPWGAKMSVTHMGEGCVTAHWMYLNRELFYLTGNTAYIDEIERSLYNHLLGSQSPADGRQSYYTPLNGRKHFNMPNVYHGEPPCCLSSVTREISRVPSDVFAVRSEETAVLIYNAATLHRRLHTADGKPVTSELTVSGDYPKSGVSEIRLVLSEPCTHTVSLRVPGWCRSFTASVGNETFKGTPGRLLPITRMWARENQIRVTFDMNDRTVDGAPSYAGFFALLHGPLVLCLDSRLNPGLALEKIAFPAPQGAFRNASDKLPTDWRGHLAFSVKTDQGTDAVFVPFMDAGQNGTDYRTWVRNAQTVLPSAQTGH